MPKHFSFSLQLHESEKKVFITAIRANISTGRWFYVEMSKEMQHLVSLSAAAVTSSDKKNKKQNKHHAHNDAAYLAPNQYFSSVYTTAKSRWAATQPNTPAECDSLWKVYDIFLLNGKHIILHVVKMFSINIQIERPLYMSKYIYYSQLIKSDYQEEVFTEVSFTLDVTHYMCLSASTLTRVWCK